MHESRAWFYSLYVRVVQVVAAPPILCSPLQPLPSETPGLAGAVWLGRSARGRSGRAL